MTTILKRKIYNTLFAVILLASFGPSDVISKGKALRVFEVCDCQFPAEIGAYKHFNVLKVRHTLLTSPAIDPVMILEISVERKGNEYRILAIVGSSKTKTAGKAGPVIEVLKSQGPYYPGKVIYQLPESKIQTANLKLNNKR